jgi:diacylglycerol kinase family enzyme
MRTLILVNPKAREGRVGEKWPGLEKDLLSALGEQSAQVAFTTAEDHGAKTVAAALKDGVRRVVVVGGDGTLSEAVQGFFGDDGKPHAPEAALVVQPAGRGDDFFKSLVGRELGGSSKSAWDRGLELVRSGGPRATDVGKATFYVDGRVARTRYFINLASFGFPGLVVKRVMDRAGVFGRSRIGKSALTYLLQSGAALLSYKPVELEVKVDGEALYAGKVFSGFALNGCYNAGGVRWSSESQVDDGLLHASVFEERSIVATVLTSGRMLTGDWKGVAGVHSRAGKVIEVFDLRPGSRKHPLAEVDGDLPEPEGTTAIRFEIVPSAIRVWRP